MGHTQTYEGTFSEINQRYGKQLADQRVKVTVEEAQSKPETQEGSDNKAEEPRPFYETATTEEWIAALREWGDSHPRTGVPLSDEAMDRESIYEGRGW